MKRASYDKQFKMAAVKLTMEATSSVKEVADALRISPSSLRRWINEYDEYGESAFPAQSWNVRVGGADDKLDSSR